MRRYPTIVDEIIWMRSLATFYWNACAKPGKWAVMYFCVRDIDFASFYDCDIWFWNCSDSGIFCFSFYNTVLWRCLKIIKPKTNLKKKTLHKKKMATAKFTYQNKIELWTQSLICLQDCQSLWQPYWKSIINKVSTQGAFLPSFIKFWRAILDKKLKMS